MTRPARALLWTALGALIAGPGASVLAAWLAERNMRVTWGAWE